MAYRCLIRVIYLFEDVKKKLKILIVLHELPSYFPSFSRNAILFSAKNGGFRHAEDAGTFRLPDKLPVKASQHPNIRR